MWSAMTREQRQRRDALRDARELLRRDSDAPIDPDKLTAMAEYIISGAAENPYSGRR